VVAPAGGPGNLLPHVVAGKPGKVDVVYYHGTGSAAHPVWHAIAAQSLDALSGTPHWTNVSLSNVIVEPPKSSSVLMGACNQGQQATLNGFLCDRSTDVFGIGLDKCGNLLTTWPAQGNLPTDGTYVSTQTSGPNLICNSAATTSSGGGTSHPGGNGGSSKSGSGDAAGSGGKLAGTGSNPTIALTALLVLAAALTSAAVRKKRN
jgi:hypothetical protein